jgi:hypothetical protein
MRRTSEAIAAITYRANVIGGGELVVHLQRAPDATTLADAWARLVAIDPGVDPMSIEIEIREGAAGLNSSGPRPAGGTRFPAPISLNAAT